MKSDEELVKSAVNGDMSCFEEIVSKYEKLVYTIAYRMFNNPEDAMDITQEVFIKVYKNMENAINKGSFKSWICTITTNFAIDEIRKRNRKKTIPLDKTLEIIDTSKEPEEEIINKENGQLINQAINQLSPDEKQIIILRDIESLSYKEIEDFLNITLGTVKSRISRARKKLQVAYTELSSK